MECFSMEICRDQQERNHRFLEEGLELVQSLGCTASEAHQLVDYVFGRPSGDPMQELGGAQVTLAALCFPTGLDMREAAERELVRVWTKMDAIRAKQAAKPKHSPLPAEQNGTSAREATRRALVDAIDSPTIAALARIFSPREVVVGNSYSEAVVDVIWPRLESALAAPQPQAGASEPVAWCWLSIYHRPLKTGTYLVGHRGHQEIMKFFGPDVHWMPGTKMGWLRHTDRGWDRDDPAERFHATHCVLIMAPEERATPSPTAAERTECGCTDECLHKPDCVFERDPQESAPK
jgi:hypothetical protein